MIPQVREHGAEFSTRGGGSIVSIQVPGDPSGADDGPVRVHEGNLVRDVPEGRAIGLANQLNPVHDPLAGQHVLVIQPKLIGQEGRREIIVGLSENVCTTCACIARVVIHGIVDQKSPVYPAIASLAILDPGLHVFHEIEERAASCSNG